VSQLKGALKEQIHKYEDQRHIKPTHSQNKATIFHTERRQSADILRCKMSLVKWWMLFGDFLVLLMISMSSMLAWAEITCPNYQEIPYCSCFVRDDQLYIQCSGSDIIALQKSLQVLNGPVKSFSVYDLDSRATVLPNGVTDNVTSPVFHLQVKMFSM